MWEDKIVKEIHRIRDEYAKSLNYDLRLIFADLRKKETLREGRVVDFSEPLDSPESKPDSITVHGGQMQ